MLTVGVDLAAEPPKTAIAWVDWTDTAHASVQKLVLGAEDKDLLSGIMQSQKAGIDCPLGWPDKFVDFVSNHRKMGNVVVPEELARRDGRHKLAYRTTDEAVHKSAGFWPLSVAADRIGYTAMRCAGLLALLAREGQPVDRAGGGVVVEVYPAASLKMWKLPHQRYKGTRGSAQLDSLVDQLLLAAPWLSLGAFADLCRKSDDALDAVVAALIARAAFLGWVEVPSQDQTEAAKTEGWIAIPTPTCSLSELAAGS